MIQKVVGRTTSHTDVVAGWARQNQKVRKIKLFRRRFCVPAIEGIT